MCGLYGDMGWPQRQATPSHACQIIASKAPHTSETFMACQSSHDHWKMRSDVRFIKAREDAFGRAIARLRTQMTTTSTCHTGLDAIKLLREFLRVSLHHAQL